jgi:tetratricopeptide (TPR) repeat protein
VLAFDQFAGRPGSAPPRPPFQIKSSSVTRILCLVFLILAGACTRPPPACVDLKALDSTIESTSLNRPYCGRISLASGEATQLTFSQPSDLRIRVTGGRSAILDAFEFGPETVTIHGPSEFALEVSPADSQFTSPIRFDISREPMSLQSALQWEQAEDKATHERASHSQKELDESLKLWERIGKPLWIGRTWLKVGDAELGRGDSTAARDAYEKAIILCSSDLRCRAEGENNSGLASRRLADATASQKRLREAIADWRLLKFPRAEGLTLSNLGLLFWQIGEQERAIASYDQSRQILDPIDRLASARVINNLGLCYLTDFEFEKARAYFESALSEFRAQESFTDQVSARINLGRTYLLSGNLKLAYANLTIAVRDAAGQKNIQLRADALNNLAQTELARHDVAAAEPRLLAAQTIYSSIHDKRGESSTQYHLGLAARQRGDIASARTFLIKSVDLRQECLLWDDEAESLYALADVESAFGRPLEARKLMERALDLVELVRSRVPGLGLRASYHARQQRYFDLLLRIIMSEAGPGRAAESLLAAERGRGRALRDALAADPEARSLKTSEVSALGQLLGRRKEIQRQIAFVALRIATASTTDEPALRNEARLLLARDAEVGASISTALGQRPFGGELTSVDILRRSLPEDGGILEYRLGEHQSYLWLVDRSTVRLFELPGREDIEVVAIRAINLFGDLQGRQSSESKRATFQSDMRRLSRILLGNLDASMLPSRLILVPDGILHQVPFAALQLPLGAGQLGLVRDLLQVPSSSFILGRARTRSLLSFAKTILALDSPIFSPEDSRLPPGARRKPGQSFAFSDLPPLPFSNHLDTIAALVKPARRRFLRDAEASRDELAQMDLTSYAIIEFFTHVVSDDVIPELSGIVLSMVDGNGRPVDGVLRPYQLSRLKLEGKLVILAGCATASGKQVPGEGIVGLATGILYAGASHIVVTLSQVYAPASSEYLSELYKRILVEQPMKLETAMTRTRCMLANSEKWADPFYWASFTVIGTPSR